MDQSAMIFTFPDQSAAQAFLDAAFLLYAAKMQAQGYTVTNGVIIGKDAATGQDMPQAQGTIRLADIQIAPDGTPYCFALADDLIPPGHEFTAMPLPEDWKTA